jgi:hypothetical protein
MRPEKNDREKRKYDEKKRIIWKERKWKKKSKAKWRDEKWMKLGDRK